jgi:hypothetical protein
MIKYTYSRNLSRGILYQSAYLPRESTIRIEDGRDFNCTEGTEATRERERPTE